MGKSASTSDQNNIKTSYAVSNIIGRNPKPGEKITFYSRGTGTLGGYWAIPVNSNPDDGCQFYGFGTAGTATFPDWTNGRLVRNDSYGQRFCAGKYIDFSQGVVFGVNYVQPNTPWEQNQWCRNVNSDSVTGRVWTGNVNSGQSCPNPCVVRTDPNFSRTYTITGVPACPAGTYLTKDVRLQYAQWPGANSADLVWSYTGYGRSANSFSFTSRSPQSRLYFGMNDGATWFDLSGNAPFPWTYGRYWTTQVPNANASIGVLASGSYSFQFQLPASMCAAPQAPVLSASCDYQGNISVRWNALPGATSYALRFHDTSVSWDNCANTNHCPPYPGSATSATYKGLPGRSYSVWAHGIYGGVYGPGGSTGVSCVIPPPSNLQATCSGTTATFTWTGAPGISQYYWRLRSETIQGGFYIDNEALGRTEISGTSFTYTGMIPGQTYTAWIHSQRHDVPRPNWSQEIRTTFSCPPPSPTPTHTPTPTPTYTPTPTLTPTPAGYCTSNANCTDGNICVNNGCVAPSPIPTNTSVPTATPAPTNTPVSTSTPNATPTPDCGLRPKGDANCDWKLDSEDEAIWRNEFLEISPRERADFDGEANCKDDKGAEKFVCTFDLEILIRNRERGVHLTPTGVPSPAVTATTAPGASPTLISTSTPTSMPTPSSIPTPSVTAPSAAITPGISSSIFDALRQRFVTEERENLASDAIAQVYASGFTPVQFSNPAIGCEQPGVVYTQVIVDGWQIILSAPYARADRPAGTCIHKVYNLGTNTTATGACLQEANRFVQACSILPQLPSGTNVFPSN
ncbi:MAG: hypothetical protein N2691_02195 [Patescibacteria group bacterium]|nr:hypothetical protein [Patescibacteria group bacterium]